MFVGHYGPAFALKRYYPEVSVLWLCVAVQLVDVAFMVLVLAGVEELRIVPGITESNALDLVHMPYTHSLIATVVWSVGGGVAGWLAAQRSSPRVFIAIALAVASHWLLDLLMHRPDLPLLDSSTKVGLGLWNYRWPAFAAEIASLAIGFALYARASEPRDGFGRAGPISLFATLVGMQLFNLLADPAATPQLTAIFGLISFVTIAITAAWIDRHRRFSVGASRG